MPATIGAMLIGPHSAFQGGKEAVPDEQASWSDPFINYLLHGCNNNKTWLCQSAGAEYK